MGEMELKPCPFCGGKAKTYAGEYDFADVMVRCTSCECEGPTFNEQDVPEDINRDAAIAHWNKRANLDQPDPAATMKEVVGLLERIGAYADHYPLKPTYGSRPTTGEIHTSASQGHPDASLLVEDVHLARSLLSKLSGGV